MSYMGITVNGSLVYDVYHKEAVPSTATSLRLTNNSKDAILNGTEKLMELLTQNGNKTGVLKIMDVSGRRLYESIGYLENFKTYLQNFMNKSNYGGFYFPQLSTHDGTIIHTGKILGTH